MVKPLDVENLVKFSTIKIWLKFPRGIENPRVSLI